MTTEAGKARRNITGVSEKIMAAYQRVNCWAINVEGATPLKKKLKEAYKSGDAQRIATVKAEFLDAVDAYVQATLAWIKTLAEEEGAADEEERAK